MAENFKQENQNLKLQVEYLEVKMENQKLKHDDALRKLKEENDNLKSLVGKNQATNKQIEIKDSEIDSLEKIKKKKKKKKKSLQN